MIESVTPGFVEAGHRILQSHRYADTDEEHVRYLLDVMQPKMNALVMDAGCGIGEVSRIMGDIRPDLRFALVNVSPVQLSMCPKGEQFCTFLDDCHNTRFADGRFDAVMFSCALCQMDTDVALEEAFRVLAGGGVLLINDMVRDQDDGGAMENMLAARVLTEDDLKDAVIQAGFSIEVMTSPEHNDSEFRSVLKSDNLEHLLDGVRPIIIRARKAG